MFLFTGGIGVAGVFIGHRADCQTERTHVRNPTCFPVGDVVFVGQPDDTGHARSCLAGKRLPQCGLKGQEDSVRAFWLVPIDFKECFVYPEILKLLDQRISVSFQGLYGVGMFLEFVWSRP